MFAAVLYILPSRVGRAWDMSNNCFGTLIMVFLMPRLKPNFLLRISNLHATTWILNMNMVHQKFPYLSKTIEFAFSKPLDTYIKPNSLARMSNLHAATWILNVKKLHQSFENANSIVSDNNENFRCSFFTFNTSIFMLLYVNWKFIPLSKAISNSLIWNLRRNNIVWKVIL